MGRPKKITPDINCIIISLHRQNYSLSVISKYLYVFNNINLSRTAIKYTIDAHIDHLRRSSHIIMVTEENSTIPQIIMAPPETNLSYIQKYENYNHNVQADVKKKKALIEHENVNSGDSNGSVDSQVREKNK